jgi:fatty-acyl-CoA synthase
MADVLAIEERGIPADLPRSTYEMIRRGAALNPKAPALTFFLSAKKFRKSETWSYGELVADVTRAANFFHTSCS